MSESLAQFERVESLSFDCYGTLIDWETGIRAALDTLAGVSSAASLDRHALFDTYLEVEAEIEAGPYLPYKEVLSRVQAELARRFGLAVPAGWERLLPESLPNWKPFSDTNAALARLKRRCRLGIVSNTDRDLFAGTARHFAPVIERFDFLVLAEDVRSYKPGRGHFDRLLEALGGDPSRHLHVAQSLYHDGVPCADLGLSFVWINRRQETNDPRVRPFAVFDNLTGLADALEA